MRLSSVGFAPFAAALVTSVLLLPSVAHADPVMDLFTLTYANQTLTYELPAQPTPSDYGPLYNFVVITTATYSGGGTCTDNLEFYTTTGGGGFQDSCLGLTPYTDPGVQLFTGDVTAPMFTAGTYAFTEGTPGVLTISQTGATPEPSSLILLGTGVLGIAATTRRRLFAKR